MAYLDPEQQAVVREIIAGSYRSGLRGRERRKARNTALVTGLVETNLKNLKGGDKDSEGWRQERKMYYKNPRNLRASVDRFYREYKSDADKSAPIGVRAQQVQQSAFPERYGLQRDLARQIARAFDNGGRVGTSAKTRRPKYVPGRDEFDMQAFAIDQLSGKPVKGRLKNRGTTALLRELADPDSEYRTRTPAKLKPGSIGKLSDKDSDARKDVRSLLGPVAKDDWKGSKSVGQSLAKSLGLPVSSEKRGTVLTASGGVSDHYLGNKDSYAWDLATSGDQGTRKVQQLARQLGVKNYKGGQWLNVTKKINGRTYRFQIGWNVPNHYDHIHMGVDRVDTSG